MQIETRHQRYYRLNKEKLREKRVVYYYLYRDKELERKRNYAQVKKDMEAWWPKVRKGGVMGGHDIGHIEFPGVAKAVEGFSKDFKVEFKCVGESDWVIIKD